MGKPPPPPSWPAEPIGTKLNSGAPITIELFLDLICPFSMKMFCALYDGDMFAKLDGKVCFVFQNVPQPWHPQTVYLHEVSLAGGRLGWRRGSQYVDGEGAQV